MRGKKYQVVEYTFILVAVGSSVYMSRSESLTHRGYLKFTTVRQEIVLAGWLARYGIILLHTTPI